VIFSTVRNVPRRPTAALFPTCLLPHYDWMATPRQHERGSRQADPVPSATGSAYTADVGPAAASPTAAAGRLCLGHVELAFHQLDGRGQLRLLGGALVRPDFENDGICRRKAGSKWILRTTSVRCRNPSFLNCFSQAFSPLSPRPACARLPSSPS
jgi:hypothetical protein